MPHIWGVRQRLNWNIHRITPSEKFCLVGKPKMYSDKYASYCVYAKHYTIMAHKHWIIKLNRYNVHAKITRQAYPPEWAQFASLFFFSFLIKLSHSKNSQESLHSAEHFGLAQRFRWTTSQFDLVYGQDISLIIKTLNFFRLLSFWHSVCRSLCRWIIKSGGRLRNVFGSTKDAQQKQKNSLAFIFAKPHFSLFFRQSFKKINK